MYLVYIAHIIMDVKNVIVIEGALISWHDHMILGIRGPYYRYRDPGSQLHINMGPEIGVPGHSDMTPVHESWCIIIATNMSLSYL